MGSNRWPTPTPKSLVFLVVNSLVLASLRDSVSITVTLPWSEEPSTQSFRRELRARDRNNRNNRNNRKRKLADAREDQEKGLLPLHPWARNNIRPLTALEPGRETVVFWHIPKSGGSTAKAYYRCFGRNVDVASRPEDIDRAKKTGSIASGKFDVVFSSYPDLAVDKLFDAEHPARVLALFRHPVDRLISKFFYLQIATWERTYRPEWKDLSLLDWAKKINMDNNHMVKKLAGKVQRMPATEKDLRLAMGTIERRFVVGLMDDMGESIRRFDAVLGVNDEKDKFHKKCYDQYFSEGEKKKNSNAHKKVEEDSAAWKLLAQQNAKDIQLYEYVLKLYEQQKELIDSYTAFAAPA